jgi:hypothetical protein
MLIVTSSLFSNSHAHPGRSSTMTSRWPTNNPARCYSKSVLPVLTLNAVSRTNRHAHCVLHKIDELSGTKHCRPSGSSIWVMLIRMITVPCARPLYIEHLYSCESHADATHQQVASPPYDQEHREATCCLGTSTGGRYAHMPWDKGAHERANLCETPL